MGHVAVIIGGNSRIGLRRTRGRAQTDADAYILGRNTFRIEALQ